GLLYKLAVDNSNVYNALVGILNRYGENSMISIFLNSLAVGYSGALMPGSLLTYTIDKSIKKGAKAGLLISLGHSLLEFFLVLLLLQGVGKYLKAEVPQIAIGFIGGGLLAFFGIGMLKDVYLNKLKIDFKASDNSRKGSMLVGGALISATNPYFIVWWAGIGLNLMLNAYDSKGILGVLVFYIGHILTDISWYCFISVLISKSRNFINPTVYRAVIAVLGVFMIYLAGRFILNSIKLI
ncbi:MAG TPA: LysE family transporter, partial [Clostridia bacterium]|nr:LysE family transporter [Clostridia bacterium]